MSDPLIIAGREFGSRLFLGTAGYPNRKLMLDAIAASGTEMVTASIRRISLAGEDESLVDLIPKHIHFLPNTAGCQTAKDAVLTAELAREALETNWIKLEVIREPEPLSGAPSAPHVRVGVSLSAGARWAGGGRARCGDRGRRPLFRPPLPPNPKAAGRRLRFFFPPPQRRRMNCHEAS